MNENVQYNGNNCVHATWHTVASNSSTTHRYCILFSCRCCLVFISVMHYSSSYTFERRTKNEMKMKFEEQNPMLKLRTEFSFSPIFRTTNYAYYRTPTRCQSHVKSFVYFVVRLEWMNGFRLRTHFNYCSVRHGSTGCCVWKLVENRNVLGAQHTTSCVLLIPTSIHEPAKNVG